MWLMARDITRRRCVQLEGVEISTAKGSTSELCPPLKLELIVVFIVPLFLLLQIKEESNVLQDGTLIDLCGATLLWRSAEGLQNSPVSQMGRLRVKLD
jgi:hypothetical protein